MVEGVLVLLIVENVRVMLDACNGCGGCSQCWL